MLGYVGAPAPLARLALEPAHSLYRQSFAPREMQSGTVNADGFGAALWLDDGKAEPAIYRTAQPIWADANLPLVAERLKCRAALAAVRSATPGLSYDLSSVQPFAQGRVAFVHNGFIERFRGPVQRALAASLGAEAHAAIGGTSDSEHIFALVLDEWAARGGSLSQALARALGRLAALCRELQTTAVATVLLSDGEELVGARFGYGKSPATLYAADGTFGAREPALGLCVASEPLDQANAWRPLRPEHLFVARPGQPVREEPLA